MYEAPNDFRNYLEHKDKLNDFGKPDKMRRHKLAERLSEILSNNPSTRLPSGWAIQLTPAGLRKVQPLLQSISNPSLKGEAIGIWQTLFNEINGAEIRRGS